MGSGGCATQTVTDAVPVQKKEEKVPDRLISMSELSTKDTAEECWIAYNGIVYDATAWLMKHPGGIRTILSNSGRDCTAVLLAMHDRQTLESSLRRVRKIGTLDTIASTVPSQDVQPSTTEQDAVVEEKKEEPSTLQSSDFNPPCPHRQRALAIERDFLLLDQRLVKEGWYVQDADPLTPYYTIIARFLLFFGVGLLMILYGGSDYFGPKTPQNSLFKLFSLLVGSAVFGFFFQQIAFMGHDAGHGSITGSFYRDIQVGLFVGNAFAGIDIRWWKSTHNVHHGATNSVHDDPDIQHLPIFCFDEIMANEGADPGHNNGTAQDQPTIGSKLGLWSTYHGRYMTAGDLGRYFMRFQHLYFYPVMAVARFNLYLQSIIHLVKTCPFLGNGTATKATTANQDDEQEEESSPAPVAWQKATPLMWTLEALALCFFYTCWYTLLVRLDSIFSAVIVLLFSHAVAGLLHVQILISHVAMHYHKHAAYGSAPEDHGPGGIERDYQDTAESMAGFHELQALTTMDVDCPPSLDWFHGGLQFQLEHHLFPRIPRSRLRALIPLVDEVFTKHSVPVIRKSFFESNAIVLNHMAKIGRHVSMGMATQTKDKNA